MLYEFLLLANADIKKTLPSVAIWNLLKKEMSKTPKLD